MAYTAFDQLVAWLRFRAAAPHIKPGSRLCDIGCGLDARFLNFLRGKVEFGVGLDYQVKSNTHGQAVCCDIVRGLPLKGGCFDCAVMLAVLEHLEEPASVVAEISRILKPGGLLVMTWPQPIVDPILEVLHRVGLVSREMESDKHQPRIPLGRLMSILEKSGFSKFLHSRFECGMNNLLVCEKL